MHEKMLFRIVYNIRQVGNKNKKKRRKRNKIILYQSDNIYWLWLKYNQYFIEHFVYFNVQIYNYLLEM